MSKQLDRRNFIKNGAIASVSATLAGVALSGCSKQSTRPGKATMLTFGSTPKKTIRAGFVGIGTMGGGHLHRMLRMEGCEVVAVCDILQDRREWSVEQVVKAGQPKPAVYGRDDLDFVRMCEEQDLDLVYNAAPWRWHTPICLAAMENGSHAASEVNIALTIKDCWKLVEMSEKTQKHCVMMENCCYDRMEMAVLNMIQKGVFGEVMHGECGYLHDLRGMKLSPTYYQGMWRLLQSIKRDGNLYPTHGIGPMAWCMDINRGDAFDTIASFRTGAKGLNLFADHMAENAKPEDRDHYKKWSNQDYALGDVNICVIKTKLGKTIICKHDTNLPRPYSRDFLVQGTKGIAQKYPEPMVYIEGRAKKEHKWDPFEDYYEEFEHPVWKSRNEQASKAGDGMGHGGMDYLEDYRLLQALRKGITPDIDVYDSVAWSAIIPLSWESIKQGGAPVKFPDFTRGAWKTPRPLGVDTIL